MINKIIVSIIFLAAFTNYFARDAAENKKVNSLAFMQSDSTNHEGYDPLKHQEIAMQYLLGWSGLSIVSGSALLFHSSTLYKGIGIQNIVWGAIDAGIGYFALRGISDKKNKNISFQEETENFRNILLINTLLDILYVGAGVWLANSNKESVRGHGYGVIIQGSFLFLFDGINYLLTKPF